MVLKLYGSPKSTCVTRVATVLIEKEVPFEFVVINMAAGEHKTPEYLKAQPFGQVPYIDDDGFILYESRAICRYIEAKYPNQGISLVPTELKANALFEQAASNESANFDPFASGIIVEKVFKKFRGLDADLVRVKELEERFNAKLDVYEKILGQQKYLAGDEITLADLFHIPYGSMVKNTNPELFAADKRPNVARWFESLQARPSWQAVKDGVKSTA